jgi:hypothetical protein
VIGGAVGDTAIGMLPEIVGVSPGFAMRRSISVPNEALSTPMKYPVPDPGSSLSTPTGANGPGPDTVPVNPWNAVTAMAAPSITDVLRTT